MRMLSEYFHFHWLPFFLITGAAAAVWLVYKNRDKIVMNEDSRK